VKAKAVWDHLDFVNLNFHFAPPKTLQLS
jgi:hypothetical protein